MAEVWEGRDDVLNRPVAVKVLLPHLASDPQLRERFRREAVTAARLVHPGIVATFDAGVEPVGDLADGSFGSGPTRLARDHEAAFLVASPEAPSAAFIVMELVPGETLRALLRRQGRLEPRLAIGIASQVADALAYAHTQGLVHRDIKPANVLLRDEGGGLAQVKVADFGIAKVAAGSADLTAQGALLGTPKYVAPEQVQGQEPDARADLYSLGVVMFEMLSGKAPFQADAELATALAHVQQPAPSLSDIRPDLPPKLVELVAALLAKQPERRPPSARALESSLSEIGRQYGLPPGGPGTFIYLGGPGRGGTSAGRSAAERRGPRGLPTASPTVTSTDQAPSARWAQTVPGRGLRGDRQRAKTGARSKGTRSASVVVGVLAVCGALAAAALFYPWRHGPRQDASGGRASNAPSSPAASTGGHRQVRVLAVKEVVVGGNLPDDNVGELPNLISATSGGYWQSLQYVGPRFGGYGGFGLALELSGRPTLHDLVVVTPMRDWSAEVFVSDNFASSPAGWGRPASAGSALNGDHSFSLSGRRASWVLLWMLDPGPTNQATIDKLHVY